MLGERFRYRDAAGVVLASLGAVTVVLSAKQQDHDVSGGIIRLYSHPTDSTLLLSQVRS